MCVLYYSHSDFGLWVQKEKGKLSVFLGMFSDFVMHGFFFFVCGARVVRSVSPSHGWWMPGLRPLLQCVSDTHVLIYK